MTRNAMSSLRTTVIFATSFEIVSKYLAPVLLKRFTSAYWHENRVIRYVLRGSLG